MKILIVYATYSGGTLTAVQSLSTTLNSQGIETELKNPSDTTLEDLKKYELVILASPSWDHEGKDGQPHMDFLNWMSSIGENNFDNIKFAVMGLGDSSYAHFCGGADVLNSFVIQKKGVAIIDPLKLDGFFMNQEKSTQEINVWAKQITDKIKPA